MGAYKYVTVFMYTYLPHFLHQTVLQQSRYLLLTKRLLTAGISLGHCNARIFNSQKHPCVIKPIQSGTCDCALHSSFFRESNPCVIKNIQKDNYVWDFLHSKMIYITSVTLVNDMIVIWHLSKGVLVRIASDQFDLKYTRMVMVNFPKFLLSQRTVWSAA